MQAGLQTKKMIKTSKERDNEARECIRAKCKDESSERKSKMREVNDNAAHQAHKRWKMTGAFRTWRDRRDQSPDRANEYVNI